MISEVFFCIIRITGVRIISFLVSVSLLSLFIRMKKLRELVELSKLTAQTHLPAEYG